MYYLLHKIFDPTDDKILSILYDGFLYPSSKSLISGIFPAGFLQYVFLSLFNKNNADITGGINFVIDTAILDDHSFRYALSWCGGSINDSFYVDPLFHNVDKILDRINTNVELLYSKNPDTTCSHEIFLKKVDLHKYLVAISGANRLSNHVKYVIRKKYPHVLLLNKLPESAVILHDMINKIIINTTLFTKID